MSKYFFASLAIIFIYIAGEILYNSMTKIDPKSTRLRCQEETITFETFRNTKKIPEAIKFLKRGNYKFDSQIRFSKYMQSRLGEYLSINDVDKMIEETISVDKKSTDNGLIIEYFVYENDKKDPGKKTKKSKLYAGYIYMDFKIDKKSIYNIQLDYKDIRAKDLKKQIECAINSFLSADQVNTK